MIARRRPRPSALLTVACAAALAVAALAIPAAQYPPPSTVDPLHRPYDQLLDIHVRDGLIYYRALKGSRGGFDRYLASLDGRYGSAETRRRWRRATADAARAVDAVLPELHALLTPAQRAKLPPAIRARLDALKPGLATRA